MTRRYVREVVPDHVHGTRYAYYSPSLSSSPPPYRQHCHHHHRYERSDSQQHHLHHHHGHVSSSSRMPYATVVVRPERSTSRRPQLFELHHDEQPRRSRSRARETILPVRLLHHHHHIDDRSRREQASSSSSLSSYDRVRHSSAHAEIGDTAHRYTASRGRSGDVFIRQRLHPVVVGADRGRCSSSSYDDFRRRRSVSGRTRGTVLGSNWTRDIADALPHPVRRDDVQRSPWLEPSSYRRGHVERGYVTVEHVDRARTGHGRSSWSRHGGDRPTVLDIEGEWYRARVVR